MPSFAGKRCPYLRSRTAPNPSAVCVSRGAFARRTLRIGRRSVLAVRQKNSVDRLVSRLAVLAGASVLLAFASPAYADLGISSFSVTPSSTQAAGHPDVTIDTVFSGVSDNLRSLALHLPAGLVGNPNAAAKCSQA